MSYRISRRISRMSRKPRVVISAVVAPLPSMSALVMSVVAWIAVSTSWPSAPTRSSSAFQPSITARPGASGVVSTL